MFKPPSKPTPGRPWARLLRRALQQGWAAAAARWNRRSPSQADSALAESPNRGRPPSAEARREAWEDLEQTVDCYLALGMVGAAAEVLTEHLKAADWAGPLPYLKLLEIHTKDDNRNAYALTKTLLEQRFAVQAPAWPGRCAPRPPRHAAVADLRAATLGLREGGRSFSETKY